MLKKTISFLFDIFPNKALLIKEFNDFFNSFTGYFIFFIYVSINSFFLWIYPDNKFNIFESNLASLELFFEINPWITIFFSSAITIKSFYNEKKQNTIILLKNSLVSDLKVIITKNISCFSVLLVSFIPTLIYVFTIYFLASPTGNIDIGTSIASYIGMFILGFIFISIGVFCSSISSSPVVSFILSSILCLFMFYGFEIISDILSGFVANNLYKSGLFFHIESIKKGVINVSDLFYFICVFLIFIQLTHITLKRYSP